MHHKRLSVFLILASILLTQSVSADDVVIGAWNIEWLGKPASRSGIAKNRQQKAADIAEYIQTGEVDILAVEEVCDDNPNGKLDNSTLGETLTILNGRPNNDWRYHLFPKKNPQNETQCVGLMWNQKKVKPEGPFKSSTIPDNVDGVNVWDRGVHAAKFRLAQGKTDIVVIPVHMKSNVGGVNKTREQRGKEAEFLAAEIAKLRAAYSDEDFLILGDTNVLSSSEPAITTISAAGFLDLNEWDAATTYEGTAPFDRIFVAKNQPEFANSDFWILEPDDPTAHKRSLSDHYMVITTVSLENDDD